MNQSYLYLLLILIVYYIFNQCQYQETFIDIRPNGIEVKPSPYLDHESRGLFALKDYKKNDVIEACPTLIMNKKQVTKDNVIMDHFFKGKIGDNELLALGYCSLVNHSNDKQNCIWEIGDEDEHVIFIATKDIKKGEEIFTNYGLNYWSSRGQKAV
jgi:SET domain-containing protein